MALNPSYEAIGKGFVQQYYALFDDPTQRPNLINMYNKESSFMTFEGQQIQGAIKIMEKLTSLSFQKINRIITAIDSQPMFDGGVLINVLGRLQLDGMALSFKQSFEVSLRESSYSIQKDYIETCAASLIYYNVTLDHSGREIVGGLEFTNRNIVFKYGKRKKIQEIQANQIELINCQQFSQALGLRIFLKNSKLYRFLGFQQNDIITIAKFTYFHYKIDGLQKQLCINGWSFGNITLSSSDINFYSNKARMDIPLRNVAACTSRDNDTCVEFEMNCRDTFSLMSMRFHLPDLDGGKNVRLLHNAIMENVSTNKGDNKVIATFSRIHCLSLGCYYDIKISETYIHLCNPRNFYKIKLNSIHQLLLLPHVSGRETFFGMMCKPPFKHDDENQYFIILEFSYDEETTIELEWSEEEVHSKYGEKLNRVMTGSTYEIFAQVISTVCNKSTYGPGHNLGIFTSIIYNDYLITNYCVITELQI